MATGRNRRARGLRSDHTCPVTHSGVSTRPV